MKIRYTYRNTGPYTHKACFCTLTLPAYDMRLLMLDANCGLAQLSVPGGDIDAKSAGKYAERRKRVLEIVREIESAEKKAEAMSRDD